MKELSLNEFIAQEQLRIRLFKEYWGRNHRSYPEDYPERMNAGDWDEQLQIFDPELEMGHYAIV